MDAELKDGDMVEVHLRDGGSLVCMATTVIRHQNDQGDEMLTFNLNPVSVMAHDLKLAKSWESGRPYHWWDLCRRTYAHVILPQPNPEPING